MFGILLIVGAVLILLITYLLAKFFYGGLKILKRKKKKLEEGPEIIFAESKTKPENEDLDVMRRHIAEHDEQEKMKANEEEERSRKEFIRAEMNLRTGKGF